LDLEQRWITRLKTNISPGINVMCKKPPHFPLVLPYSSYNRRLGNSINQCISNNLDIRPFISFTKHKNLKDLLCPSSVS
jgi:hypothetical protein